MGVLEQERVAVEKANTDAALALTGEIRKNERSMPGHNFGRDHLREWMDLTRVNAFSRNPDFHHTMAFHLPNFEQENKTAFSEFGQQVSTTLDDAVTENDLRFNLPRIDPYNKIGDRVDHVVHHPSYNTAGNIIYGTGIVKKLATLGGLREGMGYYFLANHVGEAGHNCPVVCNYETARALKLVADFPGKAEYLAKLEHPNYDDNFTSSQFLTEVQGGSDVGANDTRAWQDSDGQWYIRGEKWFCSNANAELMIISARRDTDKKGTKGLSMFLIPAIKPNGERNHFTMRRLKEKMGTRALASAEMDYHDALAIPIGDNFNFMLEKVIHHSRISLAVAVLGFASRAYQLSRDFAQTRYAFGTPIENYPLVKENLAHIKADMTVSLSGTFSLIALQDRIDLQEHAQVSMDSDMVAFSRLMSNIGKSVISKRNVDNVHHCVDGIGGNGAIENTSSMPRLLRDSIILENWEGTHNTLYMQTIRDIQRYQHDEIYLRVMNQKISEMDASLTLEKSNALKSLAQLKNKLEAFKASSDELKTLKVASIVTQMADLFYYVSAIQEGHDQLKTRQSSSKLNCAALFFRKHLQTEEKAVDDEYLKLCSEIIAKD
ncbi:MAG: acyl-CoA dehydrogenase family protein [Bermanella sp.]